MTPRINEKSVTREPAHAAFPILLLLQSGVNELELGNEKSPHFLSAKKQGLAYAQKK